MNERIRELADAAGFMDSWFSESGDDCERELKKFAELIVRECADVVKYYYIRGGEPITPQHIKKHFGVEL
jgi:hypothetical protein